MKYLDNTGLSYLWSKIKPLINAKQDTLVSGTNIKTVNNTSLLGNGNIDIIDAIYPVGSIYMSVTNTNPATLFGGTWAQIEDTFLLAAGTNHSAGTTGGEETHTLTTGEMPTHNHTFTGEAHSHGLNSHKHSVGAHSHGLNSHKHSVGAHSHGLNSHTHTYDKVKSPTGAASGNTGSTTLTVNQIPAHNHIQNMGDSNMVAGSGSHHDGTAVYGEFVSSTEHATAYRQITNNTGGGQGHTHTLNSHTHTTSTSSTNTGAATGSTANSTAFDTGAASGSTANSTAFDTGAATGNTANATQGGTIGNAGSGNAHNNMPPYLAVYVWKRTA